MGSPRRLQVLLAAIVALVACAQFFPGTSSSFTDTTATSGNSFTAKSDWTAPTISATVAQKSLGGITNEIGQGDTFYVYASVADTGNPSSDLGTVTANVGNVATVSSDTMTAGSWSVGGTTYNYRSSLLTAKAVLVTGSYSDSISASDGAGNGPTTLAGSISVDNSVFAASSFLTTNVVTAGKVQAGDKMTFTYDHAPDPESIFAGWDGSSRTVNVTLSDKNTYATTSDIIGITDASNAVTPLGYLTTGGDYETASTTTTFPNSTIVLSGSTFTVTIGTPSSTTGLRTDTGSHVATWTNYSTAFDGFGNAATGLLVTGTSHVQF